MEINCKTVLHAIALVFLVLWVCGADDVNPETDAHLPADYPVEITGKALQCFDQADTCKPEMRLSPKGSLHFPRDERNEYCNGGCYEQTQLVLTCIDQILSNFEFYHGATIDDTKKIITDICSNTDNPGDFKVTGRNMDSTSQAKPVTAKISSLIIFVTLCGLLSVVSQIMA